MCRPSARRQCVVSCALSLWALLCHSIQFGPNGWFLRLMKIENTPKQGCVVCLRTHAQFSLCAHTLRTAQRLSRSHSDVTFVMVCVGQHCYTKECVRVWVAGVDECHLTRLTNGFPVRHSFIRGGFMGAKFTTSERERQTNRIWRDIHAYT